MAQTFETESNDLALIRDVSFQKLLLFFSVRKTFHLIVCACKRHGCAWLGGS